MDSFLNKCCVCLETPPFGKMTTANKDKVCHDCIRQMFQRALDYEGNYPPKWGGRLLNIRKYTKQRVLTGRFLGVYHQKEIEYRCPPVDRIYCSWSCHGRVQQPEDNGNGEAIADRCNRFLGARLRTTTDVLFNNGELVVSCKGCGHLTCRACEEHTDNPAQSFTHKCMPKHATDNQLGSSSAINDRAPRHGIHADNASLDRAFVRCYHRLEKIQPLPVTEEATHPAILTMREISTAEESLRLQEQHIAQGYPAASVGELTRSLRVLDIMEEAEADRDQLRRDDEDDADDEDGDEEADDRPMQSQQHQARLRNLRRQMNLYRRRDSTQTGSSRSRSTPAQTPRSFISEEHSHNPADPSHVTSEVQSREAHLDTLHQDQPTRIQPVFPSAVDVRQRRIQNSKSTSPTTTLVALPFQSQGGLRSGPRIRSPPTISPQPLDQSPGTRTDGDRLLTPGTPHVESTNHERGKKRGSKRDSTFEED